MKAVVFHDVGDIRLEDVAEPKIQNPTDAIVRLTTSAICGTELHMIRGTMAGMKEGTILGHEGVGVIDAVGVDAEHAEHGPAVPQGDEEKDRFQQQVAQIAAKQNPHDGLWEPGAAPSQVLEWAINAVAKAGTVSIIGVYPPTMQYFPIGQAMMKNLTLKMGNCNHRKYIPKLVRLVASGAVDPTVILTQDKPLSSVIDAFEHFDRRERGWIKVELQPAH